MGLSGIGLLNDILDSTSWCGMVRALSRELLPEPRAGFPGDSRSPAPVTKWVVAGIGAVSVPVGFSVVVPAPCQVRRSPHRVPPCPRPPLSLWAHVLGLG